MNASKETKNRPDSGYDKATEATDSAVRVAQLKTPSGLETLEESKGPRILVVDDDPLVRDIVVEAVTTSGYHVDDCSNGLEALEKNEADPYDLIITDMMMPCLDGLSLLKNLRLRNSEADVMVITGFGSIENAVDCMKAGALDYIIKPFTVEQLQMAVKRAIEHRELKLRARERDLYRQLSYEDPLTGIYNRRFFDEFLKLEIVKSLRHGSSILLFMIDIDYFKMYNDIMGHVKGDEALTRVCHILKSCCRGYDVVTRYGGEEFGVIFPGSNRLEGKMLASRMVDGILETSFEGAERMPMGSLTVSIGMASFPEDASNAEDLVRCADEALYAAKRAGRNSVRAYRSV